MAERQPRLDDMMTHETAKAPSIPYLDLPAQMRTIRKDIDAAIARTLNNCSFCLGPDVAQFEKDFARFCGAENCVGFNSGTSALHIAMLLLNVGPGAIPPRTKAVLPVHLYGHPFAVEPIQAICRKHNLPLVEDAAQAHAAKYRGKLIGTFGSMSCFSFYPGKNLGAYGEGGGLVTNDASFAARARSLREHGSTKRYYHDEVGFNYRMEGMQGAVLAVKLKHLAAWTRERRRVAHRYHELLADTPLQLPREADGAESAYHLYVVRHPRRDELKKHLEANQVGCALHYPVPLHLQKCYADLGYKPGDFPFAEKAARECLSLPIYAELKEPQIQRVAEVVKDFFKQG